jgi:hypothetical protein
MRSAVLWFLFWPFLLALKVRDKALHRGRVEKRVENPTRALECGPEQNTNPGQCRRATDNEYHHGPQ